MLPTFELIPSSQADWRTSRTWSSHDRGVNRDDPEGWKMPWKCLRKMEVGGPIPTTENSLSKNITKQDYLAGFIPAPRSFGAHGIFTFEVWYGSGMFKIWVVWKIWKGIPKSHVSRLPWTLPFWGIPLFSDFRQTRIFTARCSSLGNLHCRMSPYFLNHTSGARRAFWGTTSGMHQKQIRVIFCFFFGTAWTFAPLQAKSTVRTSDSYADIPNSFTALLLLSQDLSEDRTGRRPIVSAGCCWVHIVVHDLS